MKTLRHAEQAANVIAVIIKDGFELTQCRGGFFDFKEQIPQRLPRRRIRGIVPDDLFKLTDRFVEIALFLTDLDRKSVV